MKKITKEEVEKRLLIRFPNEKFILLEYESIGKPGKIQCCNCGNIIEVSKISNFFAKNKVNGCKNCKGLHLERERKIAEIEAKYDILSTKVKNTHTYYTIKCKKCGHIRTSTLKNLYNHLDCGCITNVYRNRTGQEFIDEVNRFSDMGTYSLVGEYKDQLHKVLLKHNDCGFIFLVKPSDIIHNRSHCPKCRQKESKGVRLITKILTEFNLPFHKEESLTNSRQRFDFYLENKNHKIAIEYNGEQHYKQTNYFSTTLEEQQTRDAKKAKYCKDNNIKLIIIPYTATEKEIRHIIKNLYFEFNDYPEREYTISD